MSSEGTSRRTTNNVGGTLTLAKMQRAWNKLKKKPQPEYYYYTKVWEFNLKFPFIHRKWRINFYPEVGNGYLSGKSFFIKGVNNAKR